MSDDMVTAAQAAQRFGVTSNTVVRWIKQGHLRGQRKGPGRTSGWLVPEAEVRRLEAQLAGQITPADIDAASEAWDAAMPDFAGLLDADQVGSAGSPTGEE